MKTQFINDVCINREYSWLQFNKRVLDQARDEGNPLLERGKFLSIFSSNLDEFYMVRVGSLVNQNIVSPKMSENKTHLTAAEQLDGIFAETKKLYKLSGEAYAELRKQLKEKGIRLVKPSQMTAPQKLEAQRYFTSQVLPLLSPMVLDAKHPMIRFENMHSYLMYKLKKGERSMFGIMPLPSRLPRLYRFAGKRTALITIEDILRTFGFLAFEGYTVTCQALVRVTRNADFETDEADVDSEYDYDFSKYLKDKIEMRSTLAVVRLEIDEDSDEILEFLQDNLHIKKKQCFTVKNYFDYKFMFSLDKFLSADEAAALKYPPFKGRQPSYGDGVSLLDVALTRDIFLAYPFDSMNTLIKLLDECSVSKDVSSIRITIYRLDAHSRIVDALKRASENGIEVTVVIELCARFDEENNMYYAGVLQEAGCTIIYGVGNYKVHSKIVSIVLQRGGEVRYITHLGTGNYNEGTSRQYTDLNIITANESIGLDAAAFFRNLAIGNIEQTYRQLLIAPAGLKSGLLSYIDREIEKAKKGEKAEIIAKMNSLTDLEMIERFIKASQAGVKVQLIVRGICCLLPGVEGKTENISVTSIVGRFLEHSRIYCFGSGDDRMVFISSADLMTRNTDKRVEIATPVLDKEIEGKICKMLSIMLADNVKARRLLRDGTYAKVDNGLPPCDSQALFLAEKI